MRTVIKIMIFVISIGLTAYVVSCGSANSDNQHKHSQNAEGLYTCGMHPEVILEGPGQCPICGMNLTPMKKNTVHNADAAGKPAGERKILYWQAPMDPTEIYDDPGKSKMGMDLIPVYDDHTNSGSEVSIDPNTVQNMGVRTATVKRQSFSRNIRALGKVDYNEENIYEVSSKISGWIEKLHVDYTGKPVRKGQALLELYSPDLVTTQQEYLLALKNKELISNSSFASIREGAESLLASTRQRLSYWDIPEKEIQRLEQEGVVSKTITFESPANGIVIHKNAVEGKHIMAGSSLYQIADLSTVWVFASLYDNEVPWVEIGQTAEMELSYAPGKILKGKVAYIYPYVNEKSRDVKVRLVFPNPDLMLKPGMYTNVNIKTQSIPDVIVIPSEAVIRSGERVLTFIAKGEGRFEPRPIRVGQEGDNGEVLVLAGLSEGEQIVTSAQFLLDSESRLQEAIQKMLMEKASAKAEMKNDKVQMRSNSMKTMDQPTEQMTKDDESPETVASHNH